MLDGEVTAGGPAVVAAPPATETAAPWYQGADPELIGHIQNKGWHDKPANVAALEAVKAHREAERLTGIPADQILRLPKDAADEAGWNTLYGRLGVPDAADKYDLSTVKNADGSALDDTTAAWVRKTALELKLTPERAAQLAKDYIGQRDGASAAQLASSTAKTEEERAALQKNWGQNFEANKFLAQRGAAALGVDPEAVAGLEKQIGYSKIMEAFRKVGELSGEGRFINNDNPSLNHGIMTREQALTRKSELMQDQAWVTKYFAGDAAAAREMRSISVLIAGETDANYG